MYCGGKVNRIGREDMAHLNMARIIHSRDREPHPLGPLARYKRAADPLRSRLVALLVLAGLATPMVVAAFLTPDPSGAGTHRQLGQPSCTMLVVTGYPCPTCGMTTAFAHAVRGEWIAGFHAQPFGWLLAVMLMFGTCLAAVSVVTGRTWVINWYRVPPIRLVFGMLLLYAAGWAYKIIAVRTSANGWDF